MPTQYIPVDIQIDFYADGALFARRLGAHVPVIDDEIRFNGTAYRVDYRIWIYDEEYPRVALHIVKIKKVTRKKENTITGV